MLTTVPQGHEFGIELGSVCEEVRVTGFRIEEGLSSVPRCEVELVCQWSDIAFDDVMDQAASLTIVDRQGGKRVFAGLVSGFAQGDTGHRWTAYRATIEPTLHRLQYRSDSRIFQQKSVQDILTEVLNEAGVSQHEFTLTQARPVREFTVQYRESDYDFFARLCAEEGLVFYHTFDGGEAKLIINDSLAQSAPVPGLDGPVTYKSAGGGIDPDMPSFIQRFEYEERLRAGNLAQRDYWFKKPAYFWDQKSEVNTAPLRGKTGSAGQDLHLYDGTSRGHHDEGDATARRYAKYRLEEHRKDGATAKGRSTVAQLLPGFGFKMEGSFQSALNQKYLVVRLVHEGKQPQALDADAPEEQSDYFNHFEVIPNGIEWRAEHYWHSDAPRKPRVDGPQLARVVGPAGEEIFCDEYGRVKLQFPWDRHGKGDEHSSCWVRVSQLWAGTKYGGMAIPRIGQEVIVEFLDGDIDQPIITGRTYNAKNRPPYDLPVHKTRTTWKSDSHKGSGFNELRFEDEAGREEVYLHAEKDFTANIEEFKTEVVGGMSTTINKLASIETTIGPKSVYSPTSISLSTGIGGGNSVGLTNSKLSSRDIRSLAIVESIKSVPKLPSGNISINSSGSTDINSSNEVSISASRQFSTISQSRTDTINENFDMNIGANFKIDSSGRIIINSGNLIYQNGSDGVYIKSGDSSISLLPNGTIEIKGKVVKINSEQEICQKSKKIKLN